MYLILFLVTMMCTCQTQIDLTQTCTCEELENEFDCSYFEKCKFMNNICQSKECSELSSSNCSSLKTCAWNNQKCEIFTSCENYEVTQESDCQNLNHDCLYSNGKCISKQKPQLPCSAFSEQDCTNGTDGVCIYLNDQCQVWTSCSDSNATKCTYGALACQINSQNQCIATNSCEALDNFLCVYAFPQIGSNNGYLCTLSNNQCQNFNPKTQNSQTCIAQSYGFYKWNGQNCQLCQGNYSYLIKALLILLIIY